jgi:hypothetical protein
MILFSRVLVRGPGPSLASKTGTDSNMDDHVRLVINGDPMIYCSNAFIPRPTDSFVGLSAEGGEEYTCVYSKAQGDWSGSISSIDLEFVDWSAGGGNWDWEIWYC